MTRDDLAKMYNKANGWSPASFENTMDDLERFAALVAAHEREKVAAWMIQRSYATGHGDTTEDLLKELDWQVLANWSSAMKTGVETEREACAKVCEEFESDADPDAGAVLSAAIRARGETK